MPPFPSNIAKIKFICREFWMAAFNKQVDKLQTRHQVRAAPHQFRGRVRAH